MKKFIFCFLSFFFFIILPVLAIDQTIRIKFKEGITETQINEVLEFTNTKLKSKNGLDYVLEIKGIISASKLDTYSELFLLVSTVKDVDPLPREKSSDSISSVYQEVKSLPVQKPEKTELDSTSADNKEQSITQLPSGVIINSKISESRDILVSFRPGESEKALPKFNRVFGTRIVSQKSFDKFILKLPADASPKMALRALKLCPYVLSVSPIY